MAAAAPQAGTSDSTAPAPANSPAAPAADAPAAQPAPATLTPAPAAAPAATAQTAPATVTVAKTAAEPKPKPWHGSAISYGPYASAMTFAPSGQPYYNPTVGQNLTLLPEWHFNDLFFTRARMFISQELTLSDSTTTPHEFEFSDVYWDVGTTGWQEPHTGIRISGDVRFVLPTSKLSQMKTQVVNVGPGVSVSRKFGILGGLTVGYGARPTVHFNEYTTGKTWAHNLLTCNDPQSSNCQFDQNTGGRNVFFDIGHGPFVSFSPNETVSIDAAFILSRGWLYPLAAVPMGLEGSTQIQDNGTTIKDVSRFLVSVSWQFTKPVGVSLTALTYGGQLGLDGQYIFPLFNRGTTLYFDFTLDIESVTSRIF